MKRNYFFRLVMLSLLILTGQSAMAYDNLVLLNGYTLTAYAENSYELSSLDDWNALADYVAAGNNCAGKTFKMTADIGTVTKPLGKQVGPDKKTQRNRFAGTFEGNGKTLTVNINNTNNDWFYYNASYCAPFAYAQNITIKDLTVVGTITTTGQFASGLVGQSGPDDVVSQGACTIENCHVAATFVGNTAGSNTNGNHGIFISVAEGNATITNSWFDGVIDGNNYYYSGGFIGLNKASATLTDCLFNPASIASTVNYKQSSEFSHDIKGTSTLTRCYYTKSFSDPETAQGQRVRTGAAPEDNDYFSVFTNDITDDNETPRPTPDGNNYYIIMVNHIWEKIQTENINVAGVDSYSLANVDESRLVDGKLVAGKDNVAFVIPAGKTFTLNLGGRTIDRELDVVNPALTNGYIIKVEEGAKLTVTNGTIQHGHNNSDGGCIYNEGELILDGVTITKNYADGNGSGAGIYNAGTLRLNNVTIKDNHLKSNGTGTGAGVYNTSDASLHISGNVQITDNKKGTQYINLFLAGSSVITVDAAIKGTSIGIMKNTEGVFTDGLVSNGGSAGNFKNNDSNNYFIVVEGGEAKWLAPKLFEIKENENNSSNIESKEGYRANVKLTGRTLYKDGDWNTICLPFDCNVTNSPLKGDGVEARALTGASYNSETNTLSLTFQTVTTLSAGKPYLIKWTNGSGTLFEPEFEKVTIKSTLKDTEIKNVISFKGLYDPVTFTNDPTVLFLGTQNKLYYPGTNPRTIGVCRGYFKLSNGIEASGVKAYELSFEDEDDPTSIKTVYTVQNPMNDAIYNLAGQRINKMQKGINIVNGKKIIVK